VSFYLTMLIAKDLSKKIHRWYPLHLCRLLLGSRDLH
jgi:hypothetical protein